MESTNDFELNLKVRVEFTKSNELIYPSLNLLSKGYEILREQIKEIQNSAILEQTPPEERSRVGELLINSDVRVISMKTDSPTVLMIIEGLSALVAIFEIGKIIKKSWKRIKESISNRFGKKIVFEHQLVDMLTNTPVKMKTELEYFEIVEKEIHLTRQWGPPRHLIYTNTKEVAEFLPDINEPLRILVPKNGDYEIIQSEVRESNVRKIYKNIHKIEEIYPDAIRWNSIRLIRVNYNTYILKSWT